MAEPVARYTFAPWLRRGLAGELVDVDEPAAALPLERAALPIALAVEYDPIAGGGPALAAPIERTVQLLGPGDVMGLDRAAVLRCHPADGAIGADASKLVYVELYEEDLPWRYTPARPDGERLRPWLALWVLEDTEVAFLPEQPGRPRAIRIAPETAARALPIAEESWAWAHVQASRALATPDALDAAIRSTPDHVLSRLLCPRRLRVDTHYHAVVVPAFETGRRAGLGLDPSAVPAQAPSWASGGAPPAAVRPFEYPVYVHWQFTTGTAGDFESLVRALVPGPVGDRFGKRTLDVSAPGYGIAAGSAATVELEGALQPIGMARAAFPAAPGAAFADRLEQVLDLSPRLAAGASIALPHPFHVPGADGAYPAAVSDDPIVTPPIYGQHHARVARLEDARGEASLAWVRELNLDPRERAAAGLGAEVVRGRQDELVERAWAQVGELERVNQQLREAELAVAMAESLYGKHLARDDGESALRLTSALHGRVLAPSGATTVRDEIERSQVPVAAHSAAFKRITRPQRKLVRRMTGSGSVDGLQRELITRFNRTTNALTAAPPAPVPAAAIGIDTVATAVEDAIEAYDADATHPGHVFLLIVAVEIGARLAADPGLDLGALPLPGVKTALHARLDTYLPVPALSVIAIVRATIDELAALVPDGPAALAAELPAARFDEVYGADVDGKSLAGVTARRVGAGAVEGARTVERSTLASFRDQLGAFVEHVIEARPEPSPRPRLESVAGTAGHVLGALRPHATIARRVVSGLGGVTLPPAEEPRRLRPVMAHPAFDDAMFEDVRRLSQDFIIPNFAELRRDTITILAPNQRFIESYLAGLNHEMGRELLWREFPTDQRGTYFRRFWDRADDVLGEAGDGDIAPMHDWTGALGAHAARADGFLVLVIRGELLRRYPNTVVYAQRAAFAAAGADAPRALAPNDTPAHLRFPAFRGWLDPDIALFGFALGIDQARGRRDASADGPADPGWFFVLRERPGELEFGADEVPATEPLPALAGWDDLAWRHLHFAASSPSHVSLGENAGLAVEAGGDPEAPRAGRWGASAADLAYILLQDPILYARHAEELLP